MVEPGEHWVAASRGEPRAREARAEYQCPGDADHVGRTSAQGMRGLCTGLEAACDHEGLGGDSSGAPSKVHVVGPADRARVRCALGPRKVCAATDVNEVDAGLVQEADHLESIPLIQATLEAICRVELHAHGEGRTHGLACTGDHVEEHAAPPDDGAAVRVGALVEEGGEELGEKEAVRRVNLHPTKARLLCEGRRAREGRGQVLDLRGGELDASQAPHLEGEWSLRGRNLGIAQGPCMSKLWPYMGTVGTRPARELAEGIPVRIGAQHEVARLFRICRVHLYLADN
mmetsp:Transcript_24032/g.74877  ORF Transcript_24032/g.74877 Transcript_24032/m.74877 type:complete len:287 (+) Transcript_24032:422-1282(+)